MSREHYNKILGRVSRPLQDLRILMDELHLDGNADTYTGVSVQEAITGLEDAVRWAESRLKDC